MRYYPIFLNLKNKKCVVIGGGRVAWRKVNSLLRAGACVWVISPILTKSLLNFFRNKKIFYIKSGYQKRYLKDAFLAIAATDNRGVNSRVSGDAHQLGILVNVVDTPDESNFIVPATLCRGDLMLSVSTSAKAPCLSRKIKEDLSKSVLPQYARFLSLVEDIREELKLRCPAVKRQPLLNYLVNSPELAKLIKKKTSRAKIKKIINKHLLKRR